MKNKDTKKIKHTPCNSCEYALYCYIRDALFNISTGEKAITIVIVVTTGHIIIFKKCIFVCDFFLLYAINKKNDLCRYD